jgi:hypothetical protein
MRWSSIKDASALPTKRVKPQTNRKSCASQASNWALVMVPSLQLDINFVLSYTAAQLVLQ